MEDKKIEYVFFRESLVQSVLSDLVTFGFIFAGFFANAFYFGGKWYIYLFFMFMMFITGFVATHKDKRAFTNKKDLLEFAKKEL